MKPNIQVNLRDEAVVQARQTIERRVNELGVTEPSIAQQGTAIRSSCSCPASPTSSARRASSGRPGLLELKIVEQGPVADERGADGQRPGAAGHGDRARRQARRATPARRTTWCARSPAVTGTRSPQRAAVARREQPAGGQLHAEHRRRPQVRQRDRARTSAGSSRSSSTAACSRRRASTRASRPTGASPAASRRKRCRTCR